MNNCDIGTSTCLMIVHFKVMSYKLSASEKAIYFKRLGYMAWKSFVSLKYLQSNLNIRK